MATAKSCGFSLYFTSLLIIPLLEVEANQNLVNLNEDNWRDMLQGEWMVEFYAPWCPACKSLQPVWSDFSNTSNMLKIKVGQVDVTTSPGLSGRFMVTALPTIYHVFQGEFRQYKGGRDKDALISFIKDKKWANIDPIPSWQSPSSFLRSVASYFFKLSTLLRSLHNFLLEQHGLPPWGSYLVLAVGTILIGTLLGLILVCIIDCINPPKYMPGKEKALLKEEAEELDETDDIIDDNTESKEEAEEKHVSDEFDYNESSKEQSAEKNKNLKKRKPRKAM